MTDLQKEHTLHKIIAASAFVFALLILPVAQYFLVSSKPAEQGQVAGVSTDQTTTTHSDVVNPAACEEQRQKDLADLDRFDQGKKLALLRDYTAAVQPYKDAQSVLTGTPEQIQTEKTALDKLIDGEYQPYLKKLTDVENAVNAQHQQIENRSCQ